MVRTLQARPPTGKTPSEAAIREERKKQSSSRSRTSTENRVAAIREVLVPLDGSEAAEHALPLALRIAESANAKVRIVYVHERMNEGFHGRRANLYGDFDRLLRAPNEEYLADVMDRLHRAGARNVTPLLLEGRDVAESLAGLSATADLTVMATPRRSWLSRLLLGSVSKSLLQNVTKPLLIVRGYKYPVDLTARPLINHALAPVDGSPVAEEVLSVLAALGRASNGTQTLLRVIPEERAFSMFDKVPKVLVDLKDVVRRWKNRLPKLKTSVVWSDTRPEREVLRQVFEQKADFIGVATREGKPITALRPGLVGYLLRHANVPLLIVRQRLAS